MTTNHDQITHDRDDALPDAELVQTYREYAAGDNKLDLSDEQEAFLAGLLEHEFVDNIADALIATASDRMDMRRWKVDDSTVADFLFTLAVKNQLRALQSDVHYAALRDGNTAILLGWDTVAQRVTLSQEDWWDGISGMFVHYTAWGVVNYAVKEWSINENRDGILEPVQYRTVYYPDHFERWLRSLSTEWRPYILPSDTLLPRFDDGAFPWPMWTRPDGTSLKVPVVHFANANRRPSWYGESDIKNAPAYQDRMTDTQNAIQVAERLTGYQQYYSTGFEPKKDDDDKHIPPKAGPGVWHWSSAPDASFGILPAGSLDSLVKSYREKLQSVARSTRMPVHFLTGEWPSGEALLRAEMMLVDRVRQREARFGPAWSTVAHRATEIANAFSDLGLNENAMIEAEWADPERRDPMTIAAAERELFTAAETAARIGIPPALYLKWNNFDAQRIADLEGNEFYKEWLATKLAQAKFAQEPPPAPATPGGSRGTGSTEQSS